MKLFGEPVHGWLPQLDPTFERWAIWLCFLIAVACAVSVVVFRSAQAREDRYTASPSGTTDGSGAVRSDHDGVGSFGGYGRGVWHYITTPGRPLTVFTPVTQGGLNWPTGNAWDFAVRTHPNGYRERGIITDRGSFIGEPSARVNSVGRISGSVFNEYQDERTSKERLVRKLGALEHLS